MGAHRRTLTVGFLAGAWGVDRGVGVPKRCSRGWFQDVAMRSGPVDVGEFSRGTSPETSEDLAKEIFRTVEQAEERLIDVPLLGECSNRYIAVRHGQSTANLDGVISSDVETGIRSHGLTGLGQKQSRIASTSLLDTIGRENLGKIVLYSSPFKRALETAEQAAQAICNTINFENAAVGGEDFECPAILVEPLLHERWFGELDAKIITSYNMIWPVDLKDGRHKMYGCESVNEVCWRAREFFLKLESEHQGKVIVFFSHADVLQILQMYYARADPRCFSQYRFKNGEVRELIADPSSLPPPVPLTYM